nr:IgGFc-binding protein isoform X2 [Crassostrea gigas]
MSDKARIILLAWFLVFFTCSGKEIPDNMGKDFILGFMEASNAHTGDSSRIPLKLFITTSSLGTVSVSISAPFAKDTYPGENITVTKGVVRQVKLPKSLRVLGTKRSHKAVHINSSDEIVVFGVNGADFSTDGFLGIPVDVLGAQYFVPSFYSNSQRFYKSAIVIVGTKDRTSLQIKIKSTNGGIIILENKRYGNNDWLNTTISRFEVLQLQCRSDLTGTFVQSSQKISVFGGSTVTNIGTGTSRDHIEEQIPPVNVWGKRFAMSPVPHTNPNVIRVLASEDDTMITINNHGIHTLQSGQFYETKVSSADFISSNKPVLTVQYVPSAYDGQNGDPAMTLVPPIEQSNVFYSFLTPKSSQNENFENTFNFLMEGLSYKGLVLDDKLLRREDFFSVAQINNISTGYIKIPHGSHTLRHSSGTLPFGGILYGGAKYESYAFPVGQRFTPINQECQPQPVVVGDGLDNDCDGRVDEEICNDNKDNDGDGKENEDCVTELRTTTIATTKLTTTSTSSTARPATQTTPTILSTRTTTTKQPTTESTTKIATTKLITTSTSSIGRPTTSTTQTTTTKQPTTGREMSMDERRPQWFTLTEIGIISGVSIVVLGAIGMCCKKCWGLLKDRDDDDDEDEKRYRRKRRSTTKLPIGAPSIRPMYM